MKIMDKPDAAKRTLRWRLRRGRHWLDLVEEIGPGGLAFVGLVDGREWVRELDRHEAGSRLLWASTGLR